MFISNPQNRRLFRVTDSIVLQGHSNDLKWEFNVLFRDDHGGLDAEHLRTKMIM